MFRRVSGVVETVVSDLHAQGTSRQSLARVSLPESQNVVHGANRRRQLPWPWLAEKTRVVSQSIFCEGSPYLLYMPSSGGPPLKKVVEEALMQSRQQSECRTVVRRSGAKDSGAPLAGVAAGDCQASSLCTGAISLSRSKSAEERKLQFERLDRGGWEEEEEEHEEEEEVDQKEECIMHQQQRQQQQEQKREAYISDLEKRLRRDVSLEHLLQRQVQDLSAKVVATEQKLQSEHQRANEMELLLRQERDLRGEAKLQLEQEKAKWELQLKALREDNKRLRKERDSMKLCMEVAIDDREAALRERDGIATESRILCEKVDALEIDRDELIFTNAKLKADLTAMTKARDLQSNHAALLLKEKNRLVDQMAILKKEMKNNSLDDKKNIRVTGMRPRRVQSLPLPERSENVLEPRRSENMITTSRSQSFAANRKGTQWACVVVSSEGLPPPFRSLPPPSSESPVESFGRSTSTGAPSKHRRALMSLSSSSTSSMSFSEEDDQEEETDRRRSGEQLSTGLPEDVSENSFASSFVAPNQLRKALHKLKEEREALLQQVQHLQKENAQLTVRFRGAADARKRVEGFCKRLQLQAAYIPR